VKRSASSSESSEEVVRPVRLQLKALAVLRQKAPAQVFQRMTAGSDESSDSSDEGQESASDDSSDTDENGTAETTSAPPDPIVTTLPPITDNGRGDNLGYPSDYKKSIIFIESNKIEKGPSPYKLYGNNKAEEGMNLVSKKTSTYEGKDRNEIEKNLKVYKALQVHDELLEEDASTPEVESQGLDSASGTAEEPTHRQAEPEAEGSPAESAEEAESASAGDSASASASASTESDSSEETATTPGAADSDSDESQESDSSETEETSETPIVITAK
ncbi:hypothetical protein AAFF_G00054780, partial [Aldrovandia affinis]